VHESQFCIILSRITSKKSPTQIYFDTYFPCINNCWARPQGLRKLCTSIGGQRAEKFENHWPKSMGVPSSDGAQGKSLAPPCSNLRSFGSKCTVLRKVLATLLGLFGARPVIRGLRHCSPPSLRP